MGEFLRPNIYKLNFSIISREFLKITKKVLTRIISAKLIVTLYKCV